METSDRGLLDVERFDLEPDRPLFHGVLGDLQSVELVGLSTHDKVPYVLRILEPEQLSSRMAASMIEIDETLTTWPQLGGTSRLARRPSLQPSGGWVAVRTLYRDGSGSIWRRTSIGCPSRTSAPRDTRPRS